MSLSQMAKEKEGTHVDFLHNCSAQKFLNQKKRYNIGTFSMIQLLLHMRAVVPVASTPFLVVGLITPYTS